MTINVPRYDPKIGVVAEWEIGFRITAREDHGTFLIQANKAGLISLARHLLVLAQEDVPPSAHFHFDDSNSLEPGSIGLIIGQDHYEDQQ